MISIPIKQLEELFNQFNQWKSFSIKSYLHKGIFMCIHLEDSKSKEMLKIIDVVILRSIATYKFYERYITLNHFNVSHIDIEDDELERVIHIRHYCIDINTLIRLEFRGWSPELKASYIEYIKGLLKDYYVANELYEVQCNMEGCTYNSKSNYTNKLEVLIENMVSVRIDIEETIQDSIKNYPIKFGLGMIKE